MTSVILFGNVNFFCYTLHTQFMLTFVRTIEGHFYHFIYERVKTRSLFDCFFFPLCPIEVWKKREIRFNLKWKYFVNKSKSTQENKTIRYFHSIQFVFLSLFCLEIDRSTLFVILKSCIVWHSVHFLKKIKKSHSTNL